MRIFTYLATALLAVSSAGAQVAVHSGNLRALLEEKNSRVQAAQQNHSAAQEREGVLARSFFPRLELHASQESFKLGSEDVKHQPAYGAELNLNLFNGGRDRLEGRIRNLESQKRSYQTQQTLAQELEKARGIYWNIRYLQERQKLLENSVAINRRNLESAQRRIRSGVATDSDRFEFEMKEVDLKQEEEEARLQLRTQTRALTLLLGLDGQKALSFSEEFHHDHDYESALGDFSKVPEFQYKVSDLQADQGQMLAQQLRRSWWPSLDAFAAYNQYNQREEDYASASDRTQSVIGLRLTLSLSTGLEHQREAAAAAKEAASSRVLAQFQQREVATDIQGEVEELRLLHDLIHDAEENITRAERYYKMTQSEYSRGVKNSPDVLGASEKLFDRQNKRLEIIKNFQVAKAHILSKMGQ
ncbi:MAG: TolC family protein [Bdellovibrio sp.]